MFQDGVKKTILSASRALTWLTSVSPKISAGRLTLRKGVTSYQHNYLRVDWYWLAPSHSATATSDSRNMTWLYTGFLCFPFSNFRYSLTLFSKFFASFPHGTCALSVSHQYLALDGIYHPIWAAIPSNSTHWRHILWLLFLDKNGSITLSAALFQGTWPRTSYRCYLYRPQFGALA